MLSMSFMQRAFIAGILISILCPLIGNILVLKRFSMMGDTLSHSAFAGVALGLYFGMNPSLASLLYTMFFAVLVEFLSERFKSFEELIMPITLTFNIGIAIIIASSAKINTSISQFLFGSILTVTKKDLYLISIVTIAVIAFIVLFYHQLLYSTFDEEGARISRINTRLLNYAFSALTGATIGVSIRITGLLVISSILVLPVASALNFRKGFLKTLSISVLLGLITILLGLTLSYHLNLAPGGTIALTSVSVLILSLIINSRRI